MNSDAGKMQCCGKRVCRNCENEDPNKYVIPNTIKCTCAILVYTYKNFNYKNIAV